MTETELIQYLLSFLGGGVVVAVGNWAFSARAARRGHELLHIREQLERLYGPLYFFASQSERLFTLTRQIADEHRRYFDDRWSEDSVTQDRLKDETRAAIDLSNEYVRQAAKNGDRILDVLEKNWHLADPEDVPVLSQFQVDRVRLATEIESGRVKDFPFQIYTALGDISYLRPDFIERVRQATLTKQRRIRILAAIPTPAPASYQLPHEPV